MPELQIEPASDTIGAFVNGVDLATPLDDRTKQDVQRALDAHLVLVYRDQNLEPQDLLRYSRYFGELDEAPLSEWGRQSLPGHDEIYLISNIMENGRPIGALGAGESVWHSDMSFQKLPPFGSCLYAVEVPASGGATGFLSTFEAYRLLPSELAKRIEGLAIKHDATTNSGGMLRQGFAPPADVRVSPGEIHPIVKIDPSSERPALFLGRRQFAYVIGLPPEESEALLDELWDHVTSRTPTWHHQWKVGDLVQWDNRWTMHRRGSFPEDQRRLMHRTQIRAAA